MPVNKRKEQHGFTLLEMLVSIALTAVVLAILLSGLQLTENARHRGEDRVDAMMRKLAETEALQVQMSSAVPRILAMGAEQQHRQLLSFLGTPKQLRFLTRHSWAGERNVGLWLASYRVVKEPDGKEQLVVSEAGTRGDRQSVAALLASEAPTTRSMSFEEQADRIEFSYLQTSAPGIPASWLSEWKAEEQKQFPRGVQVHWWRGTQEQFMTFLIPVEEEVR
jgi:prepilin-type N-terminal cleavage/methylation domain-containing protein